MQQPPTLVGRMIGAAKLDVATYEAVERDVDATPSAMAVVILAALATGFFGVLFGRGLVAAVTLVLGAIIGWAAYAGVAYLVGTRIFATPETRATWGELLRTLGFAQSPRLLFFLSWIPILGLLIALIASIWFLVTTVVAIRQALDFTTGRAIGTAIVSWIVFVVLETILAVLI